MVSLCRYLVHCYCWHHYISRRPFSFQNFFPLLCLAFRSLMIHCQNYLLNSIGKKTHWLAGLQPYEWSEGVSLFIWWFCMYNDCKIYMWPHSCWVHQEPIALAWLMLMTRQKVNRINWEGLQYCGNSLPVAIFLLYATCLILYIISFLCLFRCDSNYRIALPKHSIKMPQL